MRPYVCKRPDTSPRHLIMATINPQPSTPDTPLRIVFLMSRFLDGGIDTVLIEYLKHLSESEDVEITLAIATAMDSLEVFRREVPANVKIVYFSQSRRLTHIQQGRVLKMTSHLAKVYDEMVNNPIRRYRAQRGIDRLAKTVDLFIDFDCCAYSFLRSVRTKKIAYFHFSFVQAMRQNGRRMKRIGRELEHYDRVVTISKAMQEEGCRLFPSLKDKMTVIYNAKNPGIIRRKAAATTGDDRIDRPYLLAVERLEESQKDLTTLLEAYALLRKTFHREEWLYIIGKGSSEEELKQKARALGIADRTVFLGFCANPYPWMLRSRLLVHSAKFEGLPTVLIEGLLLDKLMVATDCPTGPREILDDGRAGLLVPVGDAAAFASATDRLLNDTQLQADILQGVRDRAADFTFQAVDSKLRELMGIRLSTDGNGLSSTTFNR